MAQPQRLPAVNGDDGVWGDILNQYLSKEHYNTGLDNPVNGGHQTVTIRPGTTVAGTAPLKFTSGPLLATAEVGAVEFLNDNLYITQTTGAARHVIAAYDPNWTVPRLVTSVSTATPAGAIPGTDYIYLVSGITTITLPTAVGSSNQYTITNIGANTITVATTSAQTINGSTTVTLPVANMSLDMISNGSNWFII